MACFFELSKLVPASLPFFFFKVTPQSGAWPHGLWQATGQKNWFKFEQVKSYSHSKICKITLFLLQIAKITYIYEQYLMLAPQTSPHSNNSCCFEYDVTVATTNFDRLQLSLILRKHMYYVRAKQTMYMKLPRVTDMLAHCQPRENVCLACCPHLHIPALSVG